MTKRVRDIRPGDLVATGLTWNTPDYRRVREIRGTTAHAVVIYFADGNTRTVRSFDARVGVPQ